MATLQVNVVSAEESIFSGEAKFVALPGEMGELGIYPRHTPLGTHRFAWRRRDGPVSTLARSYA